MRERMGAFVYMLRCADGSFYTGIATGKDLSASPNINQESIQAIPPPGGPSGSFGLIISRR